MKSPFQNHLLLEYWIPKLVFAIIWLSHTAQPMSPSGEFPLHNSLVGIFGEHCESASPGASTQQYHVLDTPSRLFPTDSTAGNNSPNPEVQVASSPLEGDEDTEDWTKYLRDPSPEYLHSSEEDSMVPNMPDLGVSTALQLPPSPHTSQGFKGWQNKRKWNENAPEEMHGTSIITSNSAEQFSPGIQATQSQSANIPFEEINAHSPSSVLRENLSNDVNTRSSTYPFKYNSHLGSIEFSSIPLRPVPDEQSGANFPIQSQPQGRKVHFIEKKQKVSSGSKHGEDNEKDFKDLDQNAESVSHIPPLFTYNFEQNAFEDLHGNCFNIQNFQDHSPDTRVSVLAKFCTQHVVHDLLKNLSTHLSPRQFKAAQKIWTVENLVPSVYFIVSLNPTLKVWKIVNDIIVCSLLHYYRKLLSSGKKLDRVLLARFLLWQTDMFFHIINPSVRSSLTIEEEAQQELEYKGAICKSSISKMFMSIYRPKYFASMKSKHGFWQTVLTQHIDGTWKHDREHDYPSNGYDFDKRSRLWKDWKKKASQIMSHSDLESCEEINELFDERKYLYMDIFKIWNEVDSLKRRFGTFDQVKSSNIYHIDGFYKHIHAFDYLITTYVQGDRSIWGLSQKDHYLTVLSKLLTKKNHQEDDDMFWAAFNVHQMTKSSKSAASLVKHKN